MPTYHVPISTNWDPAEMAAQCNQYGQKITGCQCPIGLPVVHGVPRCPFGLASFFCLGITATDWKYLIFTTDEETNEVK